MIKVTKFKRKNPNLKGKEFIDDHLYEGLSDLLFRAFFIKSEKITDSYVINQLIKQISQLKNYKNIGYKKCTDCKKFYEDCRCDFLEENDFENIDDIIDYIRNLIFKNENKHRLELVKSHLEKYKRLYDDSFKKLINNEITLIDIHIDELL